MNKKKNCRINFQCRRKNVIMVVYGKSDCGPCPTVPVDNLGSLPVNNAGVYVRMVHDYRRPTIVDTIFCPDVLFWFG